jgi:glyoxylase-like metal-dependent hydrolase (beta-lactamase superfamily II)
MRIGDLELHLISDGVVWVDAGGPFGLVPRPLYERVFVPDEDNRIPMSLNVLVVRSEGKTILVDTGLGEKLTPEEVQRWGLVRPNGGLEEGLQRLGLNVGDIDLVINTHLHADHCGGNTSRAGIGIEPRFPRATYVVQRMEWAEAYHPDIRTRATYLAENFAPLVSTGKMRLLHGETAITSHISCVVLPGHTRGQQGVRLSSGDWRGMFVADLASYSVHLSQPAWLTAYDVLPLENLATKRECLAWATQSGAWIFFPHDPYLAVGQVSESQGRFHMREPADVQDLISGLPTLPRRLG